MSATNMKDVVGSRSTTDQTKPYPPIARAYLAALIVTKGRKMKAAEAAGIPWGTVTWWRRRWPEFAQDEREAYAEAMEHAREAAIDRAVDGIPEYSHDKDGNVLLDPILCRCGHDDDDHFTLEECRARMAMECVCTVGGCDCERFRAAPYVKRVYSDKLLDRILTHGLPKEFGPRPRTN